MSSLNPIGIKFGHIEPMFKTEEERQAWKARHEAQCQFNEENSPGAFLSVFEKLGIKLNDEQQKEVDLFKKNNPQYQ